MGSRKPSIIDIEARAQWVALCGTGARQPCPQVAGGTPPRTWRRSRASMVSGNWRRSLLAHSVSLSATRKHFTACHHRHGLSTRGGATMSSRMHNNVLEGAAWWSPGSSAERWRVADWPTVSPPSLAESLCANFERPRLHIEISTRHTEDHEIS